MVAIVLVLALGAVPADGARQTLQHVTLIGDSVADGITGDAAAVRIVSQGVDMDLETAACRRLDGTSCPPGPPTLVQLARSMGSKLGPDVVVSVGYNEFEDQYAQNIETSLQVLEAQGVQHVWWLTLRAARHPYLSMNDDIEAAAQKHPELTVIDWNVYSRSHPDWFQPDGLHLLAAGSEAMATLIHQALLDAHVALPPVRLKTVRLPSARIEQTYHARLAATGGDPPYRFSLLGRPPLGIHLLPGGVLDGHARAKPGTYVLRVQVKDAAGSFDARSVTLRIVH